MSDRTPSGSAEVPSPFPVMRVLGVDVHRVQNADILTRLEAWIGSGGPCRFVVMTGFHGIYQAFTDPDFRQVVSSCDIFGPDGIAPVWISRLRGCPLPGRATGADLMRTFFERADKVGYRSFFYGDTDDTLSRMKANLESRYPGHTVAGVFSPPFRDLTPEEDEAAVQAINDAKPDVLWVGLGLPRQERWIYEHRARLNVPVAVGVGACFGFYSGKVKRVPEAIGRMGLEWLWRLAMEPRKLWRRDLLEGPAFLWHVFLEETGLRKYDES